MKIHKKATLYLLLSLGICASILLINKFIISIPDWLAIILIIFACFSLFMSVFYYVRKR